MQTIDFQDSNSFGAKLHFRYWKAEKPLGVVCLVHGLGEHIGRYQHVAEFFSVHQFSTIGFDHQGHGKSSGKRGHSEGLESMLDDIQLLLKIAAENNPGLPTFLYGHSMGGNLTLNYVLRRKPEVEGLIATGPWIRLPKAPSQLLVVFAKMMKLILPKMTQSNGLNANDLSNDKNVVEAYRTDPLVHDRISVKMGAELLDAANFLNGFKHGVPCPTLLMHGLEDCITSPAGTAGFAERNAQNLAWKPWPGLKHEIHNEPKQGEVLAYMVEWMQQLMRNS